MEYYSQMGQDSFIDEYLSQKENGVFIEIGAHDGICLSNTYFFEKNRNWTGICIEPAPTEFEKLKLNRKSINLNCGVTDYDGESKFTYVQGYSMMLSGIPSNYHPSHIHRIYDELNNTGGEIKEIMIPVFRLQTILDQHNLSEIDYCSIDTEGSELNILKSIDFNKTQIKIFSIENNYDDNLISNFLLERGYQYLRRIEIDDIFVKV